MVQPVRRLVGELGDEELQDGSQVALAAHRHHLHWSGHGRVTVAATGKKKARERNTHYSRIKNFDYRLKTYLEHSCFKKHNLISIGKYPKKLDFLLQCVLLPSKVQTSGNQKGKKSRLYP